MSEVQTPAAQDTPNAAADKFYATETKVEAKPVDPTEEKVEVKTDQPKSEEASKTEEKAEAGTEAKPTEEVKAAEETKPTEYSLVVPEGSKLSDTDVKRIEAYAKDRGLSNEDAQKLLDVQHETVANYHQSQADAIKQTTGKWLEQAKNDKEYGGQEFNRNVELAKRAVERFGTEDFRKELDKTGLGNHPELLRTFVRIGKAMAEDRAVHPKSQGGSAKSYEELFYGGNKN